jgi:hypothetical protein
LGSPNNTVIHFLVSSINLDYEVRDISYPTPGRYHLPATPQQATPMTQNWDQLWITRFSGQGGSFIQMDLRTIYESGTPTRPEGP